MNNIHITMKLLLLLTAALLLPGCAYWDLWFVVPKNPFPPANHAER